MISIVIPTLNEGKSLERVMRNLASVGGVDETIVVDASDEEESITLLKQLQASHPQLGIRVLDAIQRGRASQINQGVAACRNQNLICLHADTELPAAAADLVVEALKHHQWGRFDLRLDTRGVWFRLIEKMINLRSRMTRIATGDQAMFFRKIFFEQHQGFADIALMEDIEFSRRVAQKYPPALITEPVLTSARRWQKHGVWRTILLMWKLRLLFRLGVDPDRLAEMYRHG